MKELGMARYRHCCSCLLELILTTLAGMWTYENLCQGVSALSLGVFTHGLGWSGDQIELFLVNVRKEMKDTRIHAYWPV